MRTHLTMRSLWRGCGLAILLLLNARLCAVDPGMPMMPMMPPPPAKPQYSNSYFTLTATWQGNGFAISGAVADAGGSGGTTKTGSLTAFESWSLQGGTSGPQWVRTGIVGMYAKGTLTTSQPGYQNYWISTSTSYYLPGDVKFLVSVTGNSASTPQNGTNQLYQENTLTWFNGDGGVAQKTGSMSKGSSTNSGATVGSTDTTTTYHGTPGSTSVVSRSSSTSYSDATRTATMSSSSAASDVETVAAASGAIVSETRTGSTSTTNHYFIGNPDGSLFNAVSDSTSTSTSSSKSYDADGSLKNSSSRELKSVWMYRKANTPPGAPYVPTLSDQTDTGSYSSQVTGSPSHRGSVSRTTVYDADGHPTNFNGTATIDGESDGLRLSWDARGNLRQADAGAQGQIPLDVPDATAAYQAFFNIEASIMGMMLPRSVAYPFFPNVQAPFIPPPPPAFG